MPCFSSLFSCINAKSPPLKSYIYAKLELNRLQQRPIEKRYKTHYLRIEECREKLAELRPQLSLKDSIIQAFYSSF